MRFIRKFLFDIIASICILSAIAGIGMFFAAKHYSGLMPNYMSLSKYSPPLVTRAYTVDGRLLSEFFLEKRVFVPIEMIPKKLIEAFLAAEDKSFYQHKGLDFGGIIRAALTNIRHFGSNKRLVGASTITQQVAKNMLLDSKISFVRKIKEALLAILIESSMSKDKILELYLNQIYLGVGADGTATYGVVVAAQSYFDKPLDELSLGECAYLAGLAKGAGNYKINKNYDRARSRRDWVIDRMCLNGFITSDEVNLAKQEDLKLTPIEERQMFKADYFSEEVRRFLVNKFGAEKLYQEGYSVHTTLEPALQKIAQKCLCEGLVNFDQKYGWRGAITHVNLDKNDKETTNVSLLRKSLTEIYKNTPKLTNSWKVAGVFKVFSDGVKIIFHDGCEGEILLKDLKWARKSLGKSLLGSPIKTASDVLSEGDIIWVEKTEEGTYALRQIPKVQGCIIAMNPANGRILAMQGGYDYALSEYNRATQAIRQPGSVIKTFIYLTAMDFGYEPNSIIHDGPISIELGFGQAPWQPQNVTKKFYGDITLRSALERSINNATVALSQEIGLDKIAVTLRKLDVLANNKIYPSTVLGAGETTLLKLARAYGILANGGINISPIIIDHVQNKYGQIIFEGNKTGCQACKHIGHMTDSPPDLDIIGEQLFDPVSVYQITHILEGSSKRGSAIRARHFKFPFACKTGTTNNNEDTWVFGYTPNLVVGIYIGFDKPECLGDKVLGANLPLPILIKFMEEVDEKYKTAPFPVPEGVSFRKIDLVTGRNNNDSPSAILEAFRTNPLPTKRPKAKERESFTTDGINNIFDEMEGLNHQVSKSPTPKKLLKKSNDSKLGEEGLSSIVE